MPIPSFHLAFQVTDLERARRFYVEDLGCTVGRESERWIDFDFFGHQITAHLVEQRESVATNPVDGKDVPVPHFGMILPWVEWETLSQRLLAREVSFVIEPTIRFAGLPGEQATMFVLDPSANALEFKSFRDERSIFAND